MGVYFQMGYIEAHSTLGQSGANYMSISDHGAGSKRAYSTEGLNTCLLYTSPSPRDLSTSRMPSSA